ncbi:hypothetical protein Q3Y58_05720 [Pseudovibrio sp. SPO723]|nr:hypothetical protein [Pseudovibrio sp. SPO723]
MVRITTMLVTAIALAGCQASMKEDFVEPVAQAPAPEENVAAATDTLPSFTPQAYAGSTDLDSLTGMRWEVKEGDSAPAGTCFLSFSKANSEQGQVLRTLGAGVYSGSVNADGCTSAELAKASYWSITGDSIELHSATNGTTAYLLMERPDLLLGYTANGADLVVSHAIGQ